MNQPATLAQGVLDSLTIPNPQPLPGAPVWDAWVFERPWPLAIVLLVIGLALLLKGRKKVRQIGAPLAILLGVGVVIAGYAVATPAEKMKAAVRSLVTGVATGDLTMVDASLDHEARLHSFRHFDGVSKTAILEEVGTSFQPGREYSIKEHSILNLDATRDGTNVGRALVKVRVTPEATGFPFFSWWQLDFRRGNDGAWRVIRLEPLSMSGVTNPRGTGAPAPDAVEPK